MVRPTTILSSLTAAAALLILTPRQATALPTSPEVALSSRGIFDPSPVQSNKNAFDHLREKSPTTHRTFSNSASQANNDDWFTSADTHRTMDIIRPNRFDKPQSQRPYDDYDGGPLLVKREQEPSGVLAKRYNRFPIWEGVFGPIKAKLTGGLSSIKEFMNWVKFKTTGVDVNTGDSYLPLYNPASERPETWYDRYSSNQKVRREEDGKGFVAVPVRKVIKPFGEKPFPFGKVVEEEGPTETPAAVGEKETATFKTVTTAKPTPTFGVPLPDVASGEATPTPSAVAPVSGGSCHGHNLCV